MSEMNAARALRLERKKGKYKTLQTRQKTGVYELCTSRGTRSPIARLLMLRGTCVTARRSHHLAPLHLWVS